MSKIPDYPFNTVCVIVENKPKKELIRMLQQMGYDSDPVKAWKLAQEKVGHITAPTKIA